ncbi:MAG: DUF4202 domain-containing protein [Nannocystaceae bacterium]|nr:DUF4202 domain-containing protein [Nannocystaceae bacterium]
MFDPWPDDPDPRMQAAVAAFARHHDDDPRRIVRGGETVTVSHDYHARLCRWVRALAPDASEAVRLAALAQHVRRFERPRGDYPSGAEGYKRWRADAARVQADIAESTLHACGYPPQTTARVRQILLKQRLRHDPEAALLEDAVCLRFLEDELADFARGREPTAVLAILTKTWAKMTPAGHAAARQLLRGMDPAVLPHSPELLALVGLTPPA